MKCFFKKKSLQNNVNESGQSSYRKLINWVVWTMLQEWKYCYITKALPASPLENNHFEINYTLGSVASFFHNSH